MTNEFIQGKPGMANLEIFPLAFQVNGQFYTHFLMIASFLSNKQNKLVTSVSIEFALVRVLHPHRFQVINAPYYVFML